MREARLGDLALSALAGVGDRELGQWAENPRGVLHLRRRLTMAEAELVGPMRDIRGTFEATKRLNRVRKWLPEGWSE